MRHASLKISDIAGPAWPSHQPAGAKGVRVFRPTHPLSPPQCPAAGLLPPQVPSRHQMDRRLFVMCLTSQVMCGVTRFHHVFTSTSRFRGAM